ncbi:MAG: GTPase HflX [Clostridiaceae bacterium]|nr:GTPase HflX [Clostridiaceae bacterium]
MIESTEQNEIIEDNHSRLGDEAFAGEKTIIVGLNCGQGEGDLEEAERSLDELAELVKTAGGVVVASVLQNRSTPDVAWFIGRGKLDEIIAAALELQAETLVFDDELSGSQIRNIEELTDMKVLDRTFVILDIFAGRAKTSEGKLQVELAQLQYRMSRLIGTRKALSRLGGGIGTRGPGETKLETDRRHISRRVAALKRNLNSTRERRERTRQQRHNNDALTVAVVGYTNAGKSSLMNTLCESELETADQVFATLDPVARKLMLPDGQQLILIDTVGFIRKLPHHLVEAFRSTLEEVTAADIIMHVTDVADPEAERQVQIVNELLSELKALDKPRLHVLNKADLLVEPASRSLFFDGEGVKTIQVSARTGKGLEELKELLAQTAGLGMIPLRLLIPYDKSALLSLIRDNGVIDSIDYLEAGTSVDTRVKSSVYSALADFIRLAE